MVVFEEWGDENFWSVNVNTLKKLLRMERRVCANSEYAANRMLQCNITNIKQVKKKKKMQSYPRNRPWRPIGL
jgi:hypothetical protein